MRRALLVPEKMLSTEITLLKEKFPELLLDFIFYSSVFKIPNIFSGQQKEYDAVLFFGKTTLNYVASKLTPTIPWYVIPRDTASLLQLLFKISLTGYNLYRLVTDMPENELTIIKDAYSESNIPLQKLTLIQPPTFIFDEVFYNHLTDFYINDYKHNTNSTYITIYSDVYKKLQNRGIPILFASSSLTDISNSIEKAHTNFLLHASRESQIIIIHAAIDELNTFSPIIEDEYQMAMENLNIAKYIYSFARKIQGAVFAIRETEYLIFSTRSIVEHQTNKFNDFTLAHDVKKHTARTLSIGLGFGKTATEAKNHAYIGLKRSQESGGNQIFLVYDKNTIRGPLNTPPKLDPIIYDHFQEISSRVGISPFTLSQIHKLLTERGIQECTVAQLSDYLQISKRAVNRIVLKLLDNNYCIEIGRQYHHKAGRPSRILKFKI